MMKSKEKNKVKKSATKSVRFCPICKSTDIAPYAGFISACYQCKKCGNVGNLFPEKPKKLVRKKSFKSKVC